MDTLVTALTKSSVTTAVELRPPRAELAAPDGIDAWIDTYHTVRRLTGDGTFVFLTDSAVGQREEHNIRHLVTNLGDDAPRERVVPFLTTKHSLDYCLAYADRAAEHGFRSLVVVGGDTSIGPVRCVERGWALRQVIRERQPALELGGWANPTKNPVTQVGYLLESHVTADFYLTQVVSHHHVSQIERFLNEATRRALPIPGVFGVFYYRSGNRRTLDMLAQFLPVPNHALVDEFARGATAEQVCARSLCTLRELGVRHCYVSNLPVDRAAATLAAIEEQVALQTGSGSDTDVS